MREMASVLKALSDETRLLMFGLLLEAGELCVCDFVEVLGITQSKASRHLRYLVNAGLLTDRRDGVWSYYRIAQKPSALQKSVLKGMKKIVSPQVPSSLFSQLAAWRKRKACGANSGGCGR
jgi:ArsR family transcriptional regulator, arsenate/arsenite/antimonite-responsive transcriptional repressor